MRNRVQSPAPKAKAPETAKAADPKDAAKKEDLSHGNNFVEGGLGDGTLMVPFLLVFCPLFAQWLAYITSERAVSDKVDATGGVSALFASCFNANVAACGAQAFHSAFTLPGIDDGLNAAKFLLAFAALALLLDVSLPGKIEVGPETATGHVPKYCDNARKHCVIFTGLFVFCSNLAVFGLRTWYFYDFGVFFDVFPASVTLLNGFGMALAMFLYVKGLYFPSTSDAGSSGSLLKDFSWGTELYPRVCGVDIKRFINCRFSMTFWMLAGLSYTYKSFTMHGKVDWGLALSAVSQFLYLVKFFHWEIGYMRSIDIIVDRAGWEIQWGCLVWVPTVYSLHTRFLVLHPSAYSAFEAGLIFSIGFVAVILNYWSDQQRQHFRENFKGTNGWVGTASSYKVWRQDVKYIEAWYEVVAPNGKKEKRRSLLLASGFWGIARHPQYFFELTAAWSWTLLANPFKNGALVLFYSVFLTILLTERAVRDHRKCSRKYGKYWDEYCKLVPYKILPGVF